MPTPINIGRPLIRADKTTQLQNNISADEAKAQLVEIARNLIKDDGSIKSGYVRLHASGESGHVVSRGGGHFRTGYSAAGSLIKQLVETAYGPDSPAAKSMETYLQAGSKITTRSLVKLVATVEGRDSAVTLKLKGKALPKTRLDIDQKIADARARQNILDGKVALAHLPRNDFLVTSALKERNWFYTTFPSLDLPDASQATLTLTMDLENLHALRSEVIKRLEQYGQALAAGGVDPEAALPSAQVEPDGRAKAGPDVGPVGRSLFQLFRDVEDHRQKTISGYLDELAKCFRAEVDRGPREKAFSKENVDGKRAANAAYRQALEFAADLLAQDLEQPDPKDLEGLTGRIYELPYDLDRGGPLTPGLRRQGNLNLIDELKRAL